MHRKLLKFKPKQMKKRLLLFVAAAGLGSIAFSSYRTGAASNGGYDCTGAETGLSNPTGCGNTGGCHATSATSTIAVTVEIDSTGGVPVTRYVPGMVYTVKISGVNNTTGSLPKFGFQVSCITGSAPAVTPTNAGTFQSTGLPTGVRYSPASSGNYVANIVEQSTQIAPTSGTGGNGTTYGTSFTWTAPAAGTGTVSFWGVLNAVNNNGNNDAADKWNTTSTVLTELSSTGVSNVNLNAGITVYPNPVVNNLNIAISDAGTYAVQVMDLNGRTVATENVTSSAAISTANWAAGVYFVVVNGNGTQKTIQVVKQ